MKCELVDFKGKFGQLTDWRTGRDGSRGSSASKRAGDNGVAWLVLGLFRHLCVACCALHAGNW